MKRFDCQWAGVSVYRIFHPKRPVLMTNIYPCQWASLDTNAFLSNKVLRQRPSFYAALVKLQNIKFLQVVLRPNQDRAKGTSGVYIL